MGDQKHHDINNIVRGGCGIFRMHEVTHHHQVNETNVFTLTYCTHGHGVSAGTKDCIRRHDMIENTYTPSLSRVGIAGKLLLMH